MDPACSSILFNKSCALWLSVLTCTSLFFQKYDLILGLLDFSFHWCVRIWLYLATDFWEEDKRAPDGMKKISAVLLLHFPYHFMDRLIDAIEVKNEF